MADESRFLATTREFKPIDLAELGSVSCLTISWHADPARIGETFLLVDLLAGLDVGVSRSEGEFESGDGRTSRPLDDPYLSRRPVTFQRIPEGLRIVRDPSGSELRVDGQAVRGAEDVSRERMDRGVAVTLGRRVVLVLHRRPARRPPLPDLGFVGESQALAALCESIVRVADLDVPVLIRGESGSGKELVARAVHQRSPRGGGRLVVRNMATVSAATAASELFGHVRGAFTGADRAREGSFARAHRGTLFLDEVGAMPEEVQAMLLRVLETGEVQPVGADDSRRVDVRVIAATDADLEVATEQGVFRGPLLHRLSGVVLHVPPLRERREDIGRLLRHFLELELERIGEGSRLSDRSEDQRTWLGADLVETLVRHPWPGNVRQLRNVARQIVVAGRTHTEVRIDRQIQRLLDPSDSSTPSPPVARPARTDLGALEDEELRAVLRRHAFGLKSAAKELGVSRTTLYARIKRAPGIRTAAELTPGEIRGALESCDGDEKAAAAALEVSLHGLRMRLKELGGGQAGG